MLGSKNWTANKHFWDGKSTCGKQAKYDPKMDIKALLDNKKSLNKSGQQKHLLAARNF